jgi:hypothetical protein
MELLKAIAHGIVVQQGVNVGVKVFNDRRVSERDERGLLLSLLFLALVNAPAQPQTTNTPARRY